MKNKLLEKTFLVLEAIAASPEPVSLKDLSTTLGLNISTASRITADLVEAGYVTKSGYRHFEAALGLIRLGQNAINSSPLPRTVNPLIRAKAEALGVHGAFAGIQHGQLVYLYRSDLFSQNQMYGLPCQVPFHRSNIAIVILSQAFSREEAVQKLMDSARNDNAEPAYLNEERELLEKLVDSVLTNGYLLRMEPNKRWNICFPVRCKEIYYGVSFYGDAADTRNFDRLLFECSLLTSRIRNLLGEE